MTTAENLNRIIEAKSDIKQAIEEKGVTVGDITIDGYADKVREITVGGKPKLETIDITISENKKNTTITPSSEFDGIEKVNVYTNIPLQFKYTNITSSGYTSIYPDSGYVGMSGITINAKVKWSVLDGTKLARSGWINPDLSYMDVSNVTDMSEMFYGCEYLTRLDLSSWETSNVTDMSDMFRDCQNLEYIKMGGDVSNVTRTSGMFDDIASKGDFVYNSQYDYSDIIAELPSGWEAYAYSAS